MEKLAGALQVIAGRTSGTPAVIEVEKTGDAYVLYRTRNESEAEKPGASD